MINRVHVLFASLTTLLVLLTSMAAPDVAAQAPAQRLWTGMYTDVQATSGQATYAASCSRCHSVDLAGSQVAANFAPALGGEKFMTTWETRSLDRLFKVIRDTMPRDTPGVLNDGRALELVAYMLKFNGYPSGSEPLTADSELAATLILPKSGVVTRQAVNFAMVQVVGCVSAAGSRWSLTQASDPVIAAVAAAGLAPPTSSTSQTFRLVNASPFQVEAQSGKQVRVQGLLRRDPDENLLNVTSMTPTGAACSH